MKATDRKMVNTIMSTLCVNPESFVNCLKDESRKPATISVVCMVLTLLVCSKRYKGQNRKRNRNCNAEIPNPAPVRNSEVRSTSPTLIPTALPIIYKINGTNRFEIKNALDITRKDEVWGWRLKSGIFWKKTLRAETESVYNHSYASHIASQFEFEGKKGDLPPWENFRNTLEDKKSRNRIKATAAVLSKYGIEVDSHLDCRCWCKEKLNHTPHYFIHFNGTEASEKIEPCYEDRYFANERIAVFFS